MSRRSVTTITLQVRLRIPPGSNTAEVTEYIRNAIKNSVFPDPATPLSALDTNSMIVKLEKKETTYL